jgi:hypothetical protein
VSEREEQLALRRETLRARSAVQRHHLAGTAAEIEHHLGGLDRGISVVRSVIRNPVLIAGAISLVVLIGPRRIVSWAGRGALLWSAARRMLRASGRFG